MYGGTFNNTRTGTGQKHHTLESRKYMVPSGTKQLFIKVS